MLASITRMANNQQLTTNKPRQGDSMVVNNKFHIIYIRSYCLFFELAFFIYLSTQNH